MAQNKERQIPSLKPGMGSALPDLKHNPVLWGLVPMEAPKTLVAQASWP